MPIKGDVSLDFDYKGPVVAPVMLCSPRGFGQVPKSGLPRVLKGSREGRLSDSVD